MTKNRLGEQSETPDQVESLLGLPAVNLESRIKQLEAEIKQRHQISQDTLSVLGTQKLRLDDQLFRQRYLATAGDPLVLERTLGWQKLQLDQSIGNEVVMCFGDIGRLKERLQEAREELAFEKQKLALLESQTKEAESKNSAAIKNQNVSD